MRQNGLRCQHQISHDTVLLHFEHDDAKITQPEPEVCRARDTRMKCMFMHVQSFVIVIFQNCLYRPTA